MKKLQSILKFKEKRNIKKTSSGSGSVIKTHVKLLDKTANEEQSDNWVVIPPDGGWGWVVVVASFLCNFVTDGCMYSFGIFLEEIASTFHVDNTQVATANSILSGFYFLLGPISCALINHYGFRLIGIIGGIIAGTTFFASSMTNSLPIFLCILGVCGGIGFNMIFSPSYVVVGFYFERWRALATSIAVCGSSIGMIIFPVAANYLLYDFNWRLKFRIIGTLLFSCSCFAVLFKPLEAVRVIAEDERRVQFIGEVDSIGSFHIETQEDKSQNIFKRFQNILFERKQNSQSLSVLEKKQSIDNSYLLGTTDASISNVTTKSILKSTASNIQSDKLYTVYEEDDEMEIMEEFNCFEFKIKFRELVHKITCNLFRYQVEYNNRPMYRSDIFYRGSLFTLPEYSKSVLSGPSTVNPTMEYHLSVTKVAPSIKEEPKCCPLHLTDTLTQMLDMSLLKSVSFDLLLLSGMLSLLGTYTPFVFSELRAIEKGVHRESTYLLLTTIGISNTIGRISCGIISSFPQIDVLTVTYACTIICGCITIASNYFYTLHLQIFYSFAFGFSIACLAALKSVLLVDMLGLEKLTNAFGIQLLFQGVASFAGIPISGLLKNYTGKYDTSFVFAGCCISLSGILLIPIYVLRKRKRNIKETVTDVEQSSVYVKESIANNNQIVLVPNSNVEQINLQLVK